MIFRVSDLELPSAQTGQNESTHCLLIKSWDPGKEIHEWSYESQPM